MLCTVLVWLQPPPLCMYYCLDLASDFGVHSCHRTEEFKQVREESKVKSKRTSTQ